MLPSYPGSVTVAVQERKPAPSEQIYHWSSTSQLNDFKNQSKSKNWGVLWFVGCFFFVVVVFPKALVTWWEVLACGVYD